MSLGKYTECDLSAGLAKLDLNILTKQIENHFYSLLGKMQNKITEVKNNSLTIIDRESMVSTMSSTGSDTVTRLAEQIAETTELLHTLYNTANREIEIIR